MNAYSFMSGLYIKFRMPTSHEASQQVSIISQGYCFSNALSGCLVWLVAASSRKFQFLEALFQKYFQLLINIQTYNTKD